MTTSDEQRLRLLEQDKQRSYEMAFSKCSEKMEASLRYLRLCDIDGGTSKVDAIKRDFDAAKTELMHVVAALGHYADELVAAKKDAITVAATASSYSGVQLLPPSAFAVSPVADQVTNTSVSPLREEILPTMDAVGSPVEQLTDAISSWPPIDDEAVFENATFLHFDPTVKSESENSANDDDINEAVTTAYVDVDSKRRVSDWLHDHNHTDDESTAAPKHHEEKANSVGKSDEAADIDQPGPSTPPYTNALLNVEYKGGFSSAGGKSTGADDGNFDGKLTPMTKNHGITTNSEYDDEGADDNCGPPDGFALRYRRQRPLKQFPKGVRVPSVMTNHASPLEFAVVPRSLETIVITIERQLNTDFRSMLTACPLDKDDVYIGLPVVASSCTGPANCPSGIGDSVYDADVWCNCQLRRAMVIGVGADDFHVQFVDLGTQRYTDRLLPLPALLAQTPPTAFICSIRSVDSRDLEQDLMVRFNMEMRATDSVVVEAYYGRNGQRGRPAISSFDRLLVNLYGEGGEDDLGAPFKRDKAAANYGVGLP